MSIATHTRDLRARRYDSGMTAAPPEVTPVDPSPALPLKPLLRGWLHAGMFPAVIVAGLVLVALSDSPRARVACGIYVLTACLLFGISALYHRGTWGPRGEAVLRRLDHANIFLIIAGTYTPLTLLLLPDSTAKPLLWAVWAAALAGIAFRVFWVGAPRWLYTPATSRWAGPPSSSCPTSCARAASPSSSWSWSAACSTARAGSSTASSARTLPRWFGFHEVFHTLTLAAFIVHYVGISLVAYQHA